MKITVCDDDINNAQHGEDISRTCPIARALWHKGFIDCEVGTDFVRVWRDKDIEFDRYNLPSEAKDFIFAWDRGYDVKPFEFFMRRGGRIS